MSTLRSVLQRNAWGPFGPREALGQSNRGETTGTLRGALLVMLLMGKASREALAALWRVNVDGQAGPALGMARNPFVRVEMSFLAKVEARWSLHCGPGGGWEAITIRSHDRTFVAKLNDASRWVFTSCLAVLWRCTDARA